MGKSAIALLLFAAATTTGAAPREVVQRAVTRVIELIDVAGQASPGDRGGGVIAALSTAKRRGQIRTVADELFDFEEVSRRALSVHWAARTPAERAEFVDLFTDLLERAYIGKIEGYAGEKIVYPAEKVDGDFAIVRSRIVPKRRPASARTRETGLEYRLHRKDGRWKVYDVIIDGVSFVSTYRSQFHRIINASSYQMLVERMRSLDVKVSPTERP